MTLECDNHLLCRNTFLLYVEAVLNGLEPISYDIRIWLCLKSTVCQSPRQVLSPDPVTNIVMRFLNYGVCDDYEAVVNDLEKRINPTRVSYIPYWGIHRSVGRSHGSTLATGTFESSMSKISEIAAKLGSSAIAS